MEQKEVDKIEVGEWIRTHTGEIGKVFKVELAKEEREKYPNNPYKGYWRDKYVTDVRRGYCTRQVIKNHSKNIIELLEAGDYLNGQLIENIHRKEKDRIYYEFLKNQDGSFEVMAMCELKNIKSIVTKEKFEAMSYRLEV